MIIERYSLPGYSASGAKLSEYAEIFDKLCDWDDKTETSTKLVYNYGGASITITMNNSYIYFNISIGTFSQSIGGMDRFMNYLIVKTDSSVGVSFCMAYETDPFPVGFTISDGFRFVLTKCITESGEEEKGIIFQKPNGNVDSIVTRISSAGNVVNTGTLTFMNCNTVSTVLYPASSAAYPGYCPHVFIPVFQNCTFTNSKCTVNGSAYYILGGTLYILDD